MRSHEPDAPVTAPPAEQHHRPTLNRVLGATSGPYEGNVRALLAVLLVVAFCAVLGYATVAYLQLGSTAAHDLVVGGFGALIAAFNGVVFFYLGKRTSEGG